ncbi:unnamed protein product [Caenorhabditis angaria]|uniref:Uncharacterized protein n=1 Tax=Caenorhabditis angaria TaxID=860376 RepID=A0A9P1IK62_9PELO|nr:unnamed protein product [Caenorhabditis angaria]
MLILILGLICVVNGCNIRPETIKCDEGWTYIQRKLGGWCVKLMNDYLACTSSTGYQGQWSGIESIDELNTYISMLKEKGVEKAFVGAGSREDCQCDEAVCPITETCQIPSVWEWTLDTFIVGTEILNLVKPMSENKFGMNVYLSTDIGLNDDVPQTGGPLIDYLFCGKKSK